MQEETYAPVTDLRQDVPVALDQVITRALARDKADRYQDAGEMASDLRAFGAAEAQPLRPVMAETWSAPAIVDEPPTIAAPAPTLQDLPQVLDIDSFLIVALDQWPAARTALVGGALSRWLFAIGETPLAVVADELAGSPNRDDDDRLREFLYRAGIDTAEEGRRCLHVGARRLKEGSFDEAVNMLRRSVYLDPSKPVAHQELARALRAQGDVTASALVLEDAMRRHPDRRGFGREHAALTASAVVLDTHVVDFGILRKGESRSARVTIRHSGPGQLQGRVASIPQWASVEPTAFATRHRQPLTFTAKTGGIWEAPAEYHEMVVLETSGGRQEVEASVSVLPARLRLADIAIWYIPLLLCCLLPIIAGGMATVVHHGAAYHPLFRPALLASALLYGACFVVAVGADTGWMERLAPVALAVACAIGGYGIWTETSVPFSGMVRTALLQVSAPSVMMLLLYACAGVTDARGWGRWQLWRWIVAATGLLVAFLLWHFHGGPIG